MASVDSTIERRLAAEWSDDPRAFAGEYASLERERLLAERVVTSLILATGGPYRPHKPGKAEYETRQSLMYFARRYAEGWKGFRASCVKLRLEKLGLDMALVRDAAKELS